MDVVPINNQVVRLASAISEADNESIPVLLLKTQDIILLERNDSKRYLALISELWKYEFPGMIVTALKQDFNQISGSWLTACQLSSIAVECCIGATSDLENLKKQFLPNLTYTMLQVMSKVVNEYNKAEKLFKANALDNLTLIATSLKKVMEHYVFTTITVLSSKHFMQLLMTEDEKLALLCLALLKNILVINRNVLDHVVESRSHSTVDELAYKISSTESPQLAQVSVSLLLTIMDVHPPLLELLSSKRYRGFKIYLNKWKNQSFDFDLNRLVKILDSQSEYQVASTKFNNAAIIIQSVYRGYLLRKRLKRAASAISLFQRHCRLKKKKQTRLKEKQQLRKLKHDYAESNRRKEFVGSRTKQLKIIENIPAKTVTKFFNELEERSATKLQAAWRGYRARMLMNTHKPELKRYEAAAVIQRQVRKWLGYRRKQKDALVDLIPSGLTDERKVQLQSVIANIRERFPTTARSDKDLNELHEKAFGMLNTHVMTLRKNRRHDEHRKALLAQLSIQTRQMSILPPLNNVESVNVEQYVSHSTPIMVAAREKHLDTMNELQQPWWKKLDCNGEDYEERLPYETEYLLENEKLF